MKKMILHKGVQNMVKSGINLIGILAAMLFCSCSDSNLKVYSDGVLEMNALMTCNVDASFETMGYEPQFVALETGGSSLLPRKSHVEFATSFDVFIVGGNRIYRFGADGRFKNLIGEIGQGPLEYTQIHNLSFNEKDSLVFIYDGSRRMLSYTMDNRPLKQISFESDGYLSMVYAMQNGFWAEERNSVDGIVSYSIVWFDEDGRQTARKELYTFDNAETASYFTSPIVKRISDNRYFYYDAFSCSGYEIDGKNANKVVMIDYGKYGAEKNKLNNAEYRIQNRNKLCEVLDFDYDDSRMVLLFIKGTDFKASIVDNVSGKCLFCHSIADPTKGGGVEIWDDSKLCVWPSYFSNGVIYGLVETSEIDDSILNKSEVRREQGVEPNPCLVKINPK